MEIVHVSREHSTNRQRRSKMVNKRHMHKIMLQILKDSEMVINNKFKVKNLTAHTYTEELLKEICKRARMYAKEPEEEPEEEPTTSNANVDLQEVLDDIMNDNDDDVDKERCDEMVQALAALIQTEEQTEEMDEDKTTIKQEMLDFQTLMELSLDTEELKDDMLVDIPYDYISS